MVGVDRELTPRRPRRWSWAVLHGVALGGGFVVMTAMVAWPGRCADETTLLLLGSIHMDGFSDGAFYTAKCRECGAGFDWFGWGGERPAHGHRDSSFSLILGDVFE